MSFSVRRFGLGLKVNVIAKLGAIVSLDDLKTDDRYELECACRASTQPTYLGGGSMLARVLGRYKMYLDAQDRGFAAHVMLDGYWEMWLTQFLARRLKPGMHVVDVGANFGYYSLLMADHVGPQGHVVTVEPNPAAALMLARSLELNGFAERTTVLACAAGASTSEGRLHIPQGEPKNATLMPLAETAHPASGQHTVPIHALDEMLDHLPTVDFLKIDTEGAEEDVIAGLKGTIERHHPAIVLEFNPHRCRAPEALLSTLRSAYTTLHIIGYDGEAHEVGNSVLMEMTNLEDRLIFVRTSG